MRMNLCTEFGLSEVHLCNDFEVIALSLPYLAAEDLYCPGRRQDSRRSTHGSARTGNGPWRRLPGT